MTSKKGSSAFSGLLIIAGIVYVGSLFFGGEESAEQQTKKQKQKAKAERIERLESQPLRMTEVSPLDDSWGFTTNFCTNQHLDWKYRPNKPPVKWSYTIETVDDRIAADSGLELDVLNFGSALKSFKKTNEDSRWCYKIDIYHQLKTIPFLKYQKGYNTKMKPEMHRKEVQERKAFYNSIESLTISFGDADNPEILSLSTKP